ncbi:saccharopine dehydrogenase NADP-binding domain-containing protein [Pseudonocardia yunnanensis]|uniref:Saccharopine dehydrogenase family protein n=1 Tax=Pseudonocardia yunnanensis TaxID=58107 RepID=A0ABW4EVR4_9PSEU
MISADGRAPAELDLVVWGATGFTGRFVAERLVSHGHGLRWGLAARDEMALQRLRKEIGAPPDTPLIVADAHDAPSLHALVTRTRMVLSTVGPFQHVGSLLVELCATNGTDYVDINGEPLWMRSMIDRFAADARRTGARIVFSCGFESVPFELGVHVLETRAFARWGVPLPRVSSRIALADVGGFTAGSIASLVASAEAARTDPALGALSNDPFLLAGDFRGPEQPRPTQPEFDDRLGMWAAPWVMGPINAANLHRSNALRGHAWGEDFTYDELMLAGPGDLGREIAAEMTAVMAAIVAPRAAGAAHGNQADLVAGAAPTYRILLVGTDTGGRRLKTTVAGEGNAGDEAAAAMVTEVARCLLDDVPDAAGGMWTPGALAGDLLVARLTERGVMTF